MARRGWVVGASAPSSSSSFSGGCWGISGFSDKSSLLVVSRQSSALTPGSFLASPSPASGRRGFLLGRALEASVFRATPELLRHDRSDQGPQRRRTPSPSTGEGEARSAATSRG